MIKTKIIFNETSGQDRDKSKNKRQFKSKSIQKMPWHLILIQDQNAYDFVSSCLLFVIKFQKKKSF